MLPDHHYLPYLKMRNELLRDSSLLGGNMNFRSDVVVCECSHFGSWAGSCPSWVWGPGTWRTIA